VQRQLSPAADKPLWAHSGSDYAGPSRAPHAVADCGRLTRCSAFPWSDDDRTAACRPASSPSSQTNGDLRASGDARRLPRHVPRYRYRDEFAALTAPSSIAAARESGAVQHFRLVAVSGINRNRAAPLGEQGSPARSVKPRKGRPKRISWCRSSRRGLQPSNAGRFEVDHPGDCATLNSNQPCDGTGGLDSTYSFYRRMLHVI
jgi:hypothetical protein